MWVTVGPVGGCGSLPPGFVNMHVCRCGPSGRLWQPTAGFHDYACGWVTVGPVGDCGSLLPGFMTMHVSHCGLGGR